jgi:hypothetical protein
MKTPRTLRWHGPARAACLTALAVGGAILVAACATPKPPTDQVAVATAAVAHAAAAGSTELAPVEMRTAREKLGRANAAMTAKDYDTASVMAQQSLVDAQLAEAKTESARAQKSADESREAARALREEMNRKAK